MLVLYFLKVKFNCKVCVIFVSNYHHYTTFCTDMQRNRILGQPEVNSGTEIYLVSEGLIIVIPSTSDVTSITTLSFSMPLNTIEHDNTLFGRNKKVNKTLH